MRKILIVTLAILMVSLAACGGRKVHRLTDEKFPATPANEDVKLYINNVQRPHIEVAYVQSFTSSAKSSDTRRAQLKELRDRARRLGAHAVMDVRQLKAKSRGVVPDERAPLPLFSRQGEGTMYMLRGTAVRFVEVEPTESVAGGEAATEQIAISDASIGDIPEIETADPDAELDAETGPRGLRQTFE